MISTIKPAEPSFIDCAHVLADKAATAILPYFRRVLNVDNKNMHGDYDPVTIADRTAEKVISEYLADVFPDHGLEGEEFGYHRTGLRYKWVVDPIDGTRSFISGSPLWGTLIALLEETRPLLGMIDQPFTSERFWSDGQKTFFSKDKSHEKILSARKCSNLDKAVLMTTDPYLFKADKERDAFNILRSNVQMTRYGGDCYSYALLASGLVDVILESGLKSYDVVALIPIINCAGGCITDWKGNTPINGGSILASGDMKLHEKILRFLE